MKALLTLFLLSVTAVSYSQINVGKIGGKAKDKVEKKAKDKVEKKADEAVTEATRDPKAPPHPGEELYDPYFRINKYIEEIQNMADSRTKHGESTKKQVGTDMEQMIYLRSAQDNLDMANKKQETVDKKYKKALDSLVKFNEASFASGNKYWVDKYQSELDRKNEIDAVLKRKHEIEETISDEMSIHLSHLFRDYSGMSGDLHKYGEEFKIGAKEMNWTEMQATCF